MALGEVVVDEFVLAGEGVVQRTFGDPGVGDDAVDADGVDALVVKQLVRRLEEALLGGPAALLGLGHTTTITDGSV
jgi:hypothetical protein